MHAGIYSQCTLGLFYQEAEATPVRPHMTPRPGQGLSSFLFQSWLSVRVC